MKKPSSPRDLPPPPLPFGTAKKAEAAPTRAQVQALPPLVVAASGRYSILAQRRDQKLYAGDILLETVEYRGLRAASMRQKLQAGQAERLAELEARLRQAPAASTEESADELSAKLRAFQRYNCHYLAAIHYTDPQDPKTTLCIPALVGDVSAGGVKICGSHCFEPGLPVVLHIRDTGPDCLETQLPSRIAWTAGDAFGLMFAGPPSIIARRNSGAQAA